ncbi:hypothetical protein WI37_18115 [Burkholderia ubonensis]|nr:hypothetical protein WI37_18115 [Burkholderia ubonensis]
MFGGAVQRGARTGGRIAPGAIFSNTDRFDAFIRIGCARPFDAQLEAAFGTLGRLVRAAAAV